MRNLINGEIQAWRASAALSKRVFRTGENNGQSASCRIRTGFRDNRQLANEFSEPMRGWWEKLKPLNWLKVGLAKLFFIWQVLIGDVLDFWWTGTSRVSITVYHKIETISRKLRQRTTAVWNSNSKFSFKLCLLFIGNICFMSHNCNIFLFDYLYRKTLSHIGPIITRHFHLM